MREQQPRRITTKWMTLVVVIAAAGIAACDRDFGAFLREKDGAGAANPGISTRNERDLGVEHSLHQRFSYRSMGPSLSTGRMLLSSIFSRISSF
jgi:hypothetical protein